MFDRKTVLVVGAGASCECNIPAGNELRSHLADLLHFRFDFGRLKKGDSTMLDAMRVAAQQVDPGSADTNPFLVEAQLISNALTQAISIDSFLDSHRGNAFLERAGKLAIVRAILQGERKSLLYFDPRGSQSTLNFDVLGDTWYGEFFKLLTENCHVEQLAQRLSMVALVVFNYDRCIEHFLFHALQNYYRVPPEAAARILSSLAIFHPYGVVGKLPWQGRPGAIAYGQEPSADLLYTLSTGIKTFAEGTDEDSSHIVDIRSNFGSASMVVFLGFAYHRLNLALLRPASFDGDVVGTNFYGTGFGISHGDCDAIRSSLAAMRGLNREQVTIHSGMKCKPFFTEYWHRLTLGT